MSPSGRAEAADAIWVDRHSARAEPVASAARNRIVGVLQALATATLGSLLFVFWSQIAGSVALCVGAVILISALTSPTGLYVGVQRLFAAFGYQTKRALTWLLLVPLFYLFFVPFGALMRRGRRDRMKRYLEPDAETYWEPHPTVDSMQRHQRQY